MSSPVSSLNGKHSAVTSQILEEILEDLEATDEPPVDELGPFSPSARPAKSHFVATQTVLPTSPTLLTLWDGPNREQAIVDLYHQHKGKGPLIEEIPDDPSNVLVTFLYQGDEDTRKVSMYGGPTTTVASLTRFGASNIWFFTAQTSVDSRLGYNFEEENTDLVDGKEVVLCVYDLLDDLNPDTSAQGSSVLLLSKADTEFDGPQAPIKGRVFEESLSSEALGVWRRYSLYVPFQRQPRGIAIFFDGESFSTGWPELEMGPFTPIPSIMDRLIEAGRLPPMVAVFVHTGPARNEDLLLNPQFADFLADELLPKISINDPILRDPSRVIAAGVSFGGLCASYVSFKRPESIGNVLSLSGSYWVDGPAADPDYSLFTEGAIQKAFLNSPRLPIRFFLESGSYEIAKIVLTNRHLRDILKAKGYDVTYQEFPGNHDYTHWGPAAITGLLELTKCWD